MAEEEKKQPWRSFRSGKMHLGIWQHFARGKDNKEYVRYSLKLQKRFYDEDKEDWVNSDSLFPTDLPDVILLCQKALEVISLRETTNRTGKIETTEEESDNIPI